MEKVHYAAKGIIYNNDAYPGHMLIGKRILTGKYEPFGGRLEAKETFEEALHREILEEVGINIQIVSCFGSYKFQWYTKLDHWTICVLYKCYTSDFFSESHKNPGELEIKPEWVSFDRSSLPVHPLQLEWIKLLGINTYESRN